LNRISGDFKFDSDSLMASFIVAEKLDDKILKAKCLRFVKKHRNLAELAMMSRNWTTISENYPDLAKNIIETMSDPNATDYFEFAKKQTRKLPLFSIFSAIFALLLSLIIFMVYYKIFEVADPLPPLPIPIVEESEEDFSEKEDFLSILHRIFLYFLSHIIALIKLILI
jgi:hypothetical protein